MQLASRFFVCLLLPGAALLPLCRQKDARAASPASLVITESSPVWGQPTTADSAGDYRQGAQSSGMDSPKCWIS